MPTWIGTVQCFCGDEGKRECPREHNPVPKPMKPYMANAEIELKPATEIVLERSEGLFGCKGI